MAVTVSYLVVCCCCALLPLVCFNAFDKDASGAIDEDEFVALTQGVNAGMPTFSGNFKRALEEFDT